MDRCPSRPPGPVGWQWELPGGWGAWKPGSHQRFLSQSSPVGAHFGPSGERRHRSGWRKRKAKSPNRSVSRGNAEDAQREQPHEPGKRNDPSLGVRAGAPADHWRMAGGRQTPRTFGWNGTAATLVEIVKRAHGTSRALKSFADRNVCILCRASIRPLGFANQMPVRPLDAARCLSGNRNAQPLPC
jgi:hypothetical protein